VEVIHPSTLPKPFEEFISTPQTLSPKTPRADGYPHCALLLLLLLLQAEIAAAAEKGELLASVSQDIRLDNRVLDLRTPANQAIFKLQHAVCQVC
jgi:hypothetical protein